MNIFSRIRISTKLAGSFAFMMILTASIGLMGIHEMGMIAKMAEQSYTHDTLAIVYLKQADIDLTKIAVAEKNLLLSTTPKQINQFKARIQSFQQKVNSDLAMARPLIQSESGKRQLTEVDRTWMVRQDFMRQLAQLANGNPEQQRAANVLSVSVGLPKAEAVEKTLGVLTANEEENARRSADETARTYRRNLIFMLCTIGCGVALSVFAYLRLKSLIVVPLHKVCGNLRKLANKDLTFHIEETGTDEMGELTRDLNLCTKAMREVLGEIANSSKSLSHAAQELSAKANLSRDNSHLQSAQTAQIAAASQEMTATIREIGSNLGTASRTSRVTYESATSGGTVMQQASKSIANLSQTTALSVERMQKLVERSQEIGKIVTTIEEISERTNLLALNAAIEAARAGDAGLGFAVVASEVRRLAERTKSATLEITTTVRNIQEETGQVMAAMSSSNSDVAAGTQAADHAYEGLKSIIAAADEMDAMIQRISTSVTEQTAASGEIENGANRIAVLSTQNGHVADDTSDACNQLACLAVALDAILAQFSI